MPSGRERGFVYIGLLIGVAIIGLGLSAVAQVWQQSRQREREEELLFVGNQFRQAITRYYLETPRGVANFPVRLEDMLSDQRAPDKLKHQLRRIYEDPITGKAEWGELRLPNGQLIGVYSLSNDAPLKVAGFKLSDLTFADKARYSEWVFRSALPAANPGRAPAGGGRPSGPAGGAGNSPKPGQPGAIPSAPSPFKP